MANHKSSLKRIKTNDKKRVHNRYFARTMRNAVRDFRAVTEKSEAQESFSKVISIIDKSAKRGLIHKKKAANLKSKMAIKLNNM
ncbi:MAG: 30S ribosomal protein S20 [Bacteroidetes bacterium CG2_30_33_31]|nr:MAG: 30S ribosomal protein S20 [Bacteroidetes bacterium CG2_30_33_31]